MAGRRDGEPESVGAFVHGRVHRLEELPLLIGGEGVRLVDDDRARVGAVCDVAVRRDGAKDALGLGPRNLAPTDDEMLRERARLGEAARVLEDDARLVARRRRADDIRLVRARHQLVEADCGGDRALPVPARDAQDGALVDAVPTLVQAVELVHELTLPRLEEKWLAGRRPLLVAQALGEEVAGREREGVTIARAAGGCRDDVTVALRLLELERDRTPLRLGCRLLVGALNRTQPLFAD